MKMIALILLFSLLLFTSCASNRVTMTFYSDPPGATIYNLKTGNKLCNYTPCTVPINISPELINQKRVGITGTKAVWASGASASINYLVVNLLENTEFHYTFQRPNVPDRHIDVSIGLQLEQTRMLRRQAEAQEEQTRIQDDQLFFQMLDSLLKK